MGLCLSVPPHYSYFTVIFSGHHANTRLHVQHSLGAAARDRTRVALGQLELAEFIRWPPDYISVVTFCHEPNVRRFARHSLSFSSGFFSQYYRVSEYE